jgi:hypothetical protein
MNGCVINTVEREDVYLWNPYDDGRPWVAPSLKTYIDWWLSGKLVIALPHSSLAPPRNPPRELFIAQPVAYLFQPLVGPLPFQIGQRFLQWHILA